MTKQAAEAVLQAYRDGFTRQAVYLRSDKALIPEVASIPQVKDSLLMARSLVEKTLPVVRDFAESLWNCSDLKDLRSSPLDSGAAALLYGTAEDPQRDAAVLYMPSLDVLSSPQVTKFLEGMKDRLVVAVNTEKARVPWEVGKSPNGIQQGVTVPVFDAFGLESFYYSATILNNWNTILFRVYPNPWEIWVESLDYELELVGTSEAKPSSKIIIEAQREYEQERDISVVQKMGKCFKDQFMG